MAKTTAPLLSFGAQGAIGKTQVYGSWRGVKYARRYSVPANPQTTAQQHTRGVFSYINGLWKAMDPALQSPWTLFAKGKAFYNRNAFQSQNVQGLRGIGTSYATDKSMLVMSPGANAGLAPGALTGTDGGSHAISAALTAPDLPTGWTITKAHFVAVNDSAAWDDTDYTSVYASDDSSPYAASLSMGAAGDYRLSAFFEYVKPDGSTAYSPSVNVAVTLA